MTEPIHGDSFEVMAAMEPESVDAVVTDPPYGLEFMGKAWDKLGAVVEHPDDGEGPWGRTSRVRYGSSARSMQAWHQGWAELAFRLARPSAYLVAFGGTRTVHRLAVAIEDAGWVIRDQLVWAYASGFPKSKASLKPAWEPIVLARKPGPARNLNIDACRLPYGSEADAQAALEQGASFGRSLQNGTVVQSAAIGRESRDGSDPGGLDDRGRWPANVVLTDPVFHGGWEGVVGGGETGRGVFPGAGHAGARTSYLDGLPSIGPRADTDDGTYSRYFLIPKAGRTDREPVLGGLSGLDLYGPELAFDALNATLGNAQAIRRRNGHPTVKPVQLMRHLVRLVTPPGGTVLDPFLGSGTTAIAAAIEGFPWVGIEREADYIAIARARLNGTQLGFGLDVEAPTPRPLSSSPENANGRINAAGRRPHGGLIYGEHGGTDPTPDEPPDLGL